MDVLSEIINSSGLKGYMITRDTFFRNWGYKFPCNQSFGFHIITRGNCYIRYKKKIEKLEKGDIVFISRGFDHELVSSTNQKALDIKSLPEEYFKPGKEKEEPIVTLLSIRYEIQEMIHPFFFELPDIIIVKENNIPSHHPIHSALVLISNEMAIGENSELVLQKLADVLLYYILKFWVDREETGAPGWIKTFKDEKILYALDILHKDLSKDWT
ncbi:MAG: cupin domain-containing protein, partial [Leptospiraceae bacterium]|nr:cupin domain-containing protein [Leptospiraceae bacterium]